MRRPFVSSMLIAALVACGCDSLGRGNVPPAELTMTAEPGPPTLSAAASAASSPTGNCYYVWASHDLPDLSQKLGRALQAADAGISGSAYAYGEDCVFEDGRRSFSAIETDFRVRIRVADFKDEEALGDGMAMAMGIIGELQTAELAGNHAGRVDFAFLTSDAQELHVSVDVDKYRAAAGGISGAQLFRLFYVLP